MTLDATRSVAATLVDAIEDEARHAADLLCDAVGHRDVAPQKPTARASAPRIPLPNALAAAASLRRDEWRCGGLDRYLPAGAAQPRTARCGALHELHVEPTLRHATELRWFAAATLITWIRHFAWTARRHLGCDVVLSWAANGDPYDLLEHMAEYVWRYRRQCKLEGETGDACTQT